MTNSARILIVDDSTTVRLYYRKALEAAGFVVDEAENGVAGLERALATDFEMLLVDVNMPMMDGYEFVCLLRSPPNDCTVPIVMISSEPEAKDRRAAYAAGANLYLVKPVKAHELAELVRLSTGRG